MIEAIRNIGEYALGKEEKNVDNPLEILIDNPANKNTKNILFILLDEENREFKYHGIETEEYSKDKLENYLYKKGTSRGTDITPTVMITTPEKTFNNKILNWFKNYNSDKNNKNEMLQNIYLCIKENKEKILQDLKEKSDIENNIISFKINEKYLGDFEIFRKILVNKASENFYNKFGKISKSENKLCSICKKNNTEVYGFVSTFNFYTVDKKGFVSGGFKQRDAWKNYPVCLNCALTLERGKKYLEENLNFNFYGFRYLLIPKFIKGVKKDIQKDIFKKIELQKDPRFRKKEIKNLTNDENEALETMSEQGNYLNNNFLFYSAPKGFNGAVFNILLYIEDILPSRLKQLFEAKNVVDQEEIFQNCEIDIYRDRKKIGKGPLEFNFGILRTFFPRITNNRTFNKYFLDITNKIFTKKPVEYDFLLNFIVKKIRDDFMQNYPTKIDTLKAFMLLNYLNELNILKYKKEESTKMEKSILPKEIGGEIKEKTEVFFDKFSNFFDSDIKKAIFLEGVLAQFLLNIQYQERKANPFRIKLKGLKLDEKQIRKLLPEIQNKLEEYGKNYYRDLESIISNYFVSSGNDWNVSNDEISFYFVLGMNLSDVFKKEKNNGGKEDE
ncbi:MAG TPA: TIGR02556 family CRISPR-associated protein [Candidatus Atribacteria bacterium]|nr:TIGR02556 family CRISPR-associated protein [Candidatus Atribacteria bacterium]